MASSEGAAAVRVHIDVRIVGGDSRAAGVIESHVLALGGTVAPRGRGLALRLGARTKGSASHLVWKDGDPALFHAARDAAVAVVRPSWIDACVAAGAMWSSRVGGGLPCVAPSAIW